MKTELLHVSSAWRSEGPRNDCVLIQGWTAQKFMFGAVHMLFVVPLGSQQLQIAVIK
jgi:hypothetical protein